MKVNGINTHQYFIFNRIASGIYQAKKVNTTTRISTPIDWAGKVVVANRIKLGTEVSVAIFLRIC